MRAVPEHHAERDDVLLNARHAADETIGTDAHELMHGAQAAENSVIADRDVTGKRRVVNEDHTIADLTVMGDMGAHHQQAISADAGHESAGLGAWSDCC